MAAGDVYRVTLKQQYTDAGIAVQHVLWFERTDEASVDGVTEVIANTVLSNWIDTPSGVFPWTWLKSPAFSVQGAEAQRMYPTAGAPAVVDVAGPVVGVGTDYGGGVPAVCCMVSTLRTADGGRRGRGRLYLGGFAARTPNNPGFWGENPTVGDHGLWEVNTVDRQLAHLQKLLDDVWNGIEDLAGGLMLRWGIFSRANAGAQVPPFPSNGFNPITSITLDGVVRVQRRREYGHGI